MGVRRRTNGRQGARLSSRSQLAYLLAVALGMLGLSSVALAATAAGQHSAKVAKLEVHPPKSQLECEEEYGLGTSWHRCFNEPPGSSCKHPLEVQRAGPTIRGDAKDFVTSVHEEGTNAGVQQYYSWKPKKGIAICPYPDGVIYKVSLLAREEICETIHGQKYCTTEYDTKNIYIHSSPHGVSLEYYVAYNPNNTPSKSYYLVIRGYYVHPSQEGRRRVADAEPADNSDIEHVERNA